MTRCSASRQREQLSLFQAPGLKEAGVNYLGVIIVVAVGTKFDVATLQAPTTVTLIEGRVNVRIGDVETEAIALQRYFGLRETSRSGSAIVLERN